MRILLAIAVSEFPNIAGKYFFLFLPSLFLYYRNEKKALCELMLKNSSQIEKYRIKLNFKS